MRLSLVMCLALLVPVAAQAGAWGPGSFENDDALDWIGDCADAKSAAPVRAAFATVLNRAYIQAPDASAAVAAAEVVAAAVGKPHKHPPTELTKCIKRQSLDQLRKLIPTARRALSRILDPKISELSQLWVQAGSSTTWRQAIADLEARLGQ